MLIIIAVSIILLLPILSYLLNPLSKQKSLIFLFTFLFFGSFLVNFVSNNSLLGSWVDANHSDSILHAISSDEEFNDDLIKNFFANESSAEKSFLLGVDIFYKSLELKSFNSAESILRKLNTQFSSENFQVPIFNLLADLRDLKYPDLANSKVLLSIENPPNCNLQSLQFFVSILGGPQINIAAREIISPNIEELISLDKSNSLVRGFDITSAFLQQETIKVEAQAKCDNGLFQSFKSIDLRYSKDNKEKLFFYTNEWLKKQQ